MAKNTALSFKIEGLQELDAALAELPKATAKNVALRVLKKNAEPIRDAGEAMAPFKTGALQESYSISTKLSRVTKGKSPKESPVEVYVGPASWAQKQGVQTEFGNSHQAPQPHLRPAWDGSVQLVLDNIAKDLGLEIEKARQRVARKAEREAAKMK